MTGFGRATKKQPEGTLTAEIRSVNGRFLKVGVKAPPRMGSFEGRVKKLLGCLGVRRGSLDVYVGINESSGTGTNFKINPDVVRQYASQLKGIKASQDLKAGALAWGDLLQLPGVVEKDEATTDLDELWKRFEDVFKEAFAQFDAMRIKEGSAMRADVSERLADLRRHRKDLAKYAPQAKKEAVRKFKARITELLKKSNADQNADEVNLEREVVLIADRMDISEELARLESHFEQMDGILDEGAEVGKRLDFLTQELFREINTIGSKAQNESITHRVVEMKEQVEKIREQVQNLE